MNHKYDIYYLASGLVLASVVNILRLGFDVPLPNWLSLTALIFSIVLIGIYAGRYGRVARRPKTRINNDWNELPNATTNKKNKKTI